MRTALTVISLWTSALCLLACAGPSESGEDIAIGVIVPLKRSPTTLEGARLAAEEINAAGGVVAGGERRKIRLLVADSEHRPEVAVSQALKLVNLEGVVALVGVPLSTNAIPVARIAEQSRIPMISTLSTHPETTAGKEFVFRLNVADPKQGQAMADFAYRRLGARRAAALANATSAYSTSIAEIFGAAFRDHGGHLTAFETFTEDDLDVTEKLRAIVATEPDVLYLPNHFRFVQMHMARAREIGVAARFLGADTWNLIEDYPAGAGESYFTDVWTPDYPNAKAAAFVELYTRSYGKTPPTSAVLAYDAVFIVAEAIRAKGKADPDSIREGISGIEYLGASGLIKFAPSGDALRHVLIRQIDDQGRVSFFEEVEP